MNAENPFKQLEGNLREVPEELRKQVFNDVLRAKLIMEISSHFLDDIPKAIQSMFKIDLKDLK